MILKENYKEFQKEIEKRKIEFLIHFTPTINLYSILENKKIMSRAILENLDIDQFDILDYVKFTDDVRYDDKNYINLSLSGPNTYLFKKFQEKTKNDCTINWCVLKINTQLIYENDTLFSVTNAASNTAKKQYGISGDLDKFKMLFKKEIIINNFNRKQKIIRNSILSKYPTDVQAEILVKNEILSNNILSICFKSEEEMAESKAAMNSFDTSNFIVNKKIFFPDRSL